MYPTPKSLRAKISPNKIYEARLDRNRLSIISRRSRAERWSIEFDRFNLRPPLVYRWSRDSKSIAVLIARSLPPKVGAGPAYTNHYWMGLWFPADDELFAVRFDGQSELERNGILANSVEPADDGRTVIARVGKTEVCRVRMPDEPLKSIWEQRIVAEAPRSVDAERTKTLDWTWLHTSDGYEGLKFENGHLLWFQHSNNPFAGGAAAEQGFDDFLANGPQCCLPPELFAEVVTAVREAVGMRDAQNTK